MTEKVEVHTTGAPHDGDKDETALEATSDAALERALDQLFTAVAHVRHVLHARDVARFAAGTLVPDTPLAQDAYVSGMDMAVQAQRQLTLLAEHAVALSPAWLAQGFVDTLAGTVRVDAVQRQEGQARLAAYLSRVSTPASSRTGHQRGEQKHENGDGGNA